MIRRFTISLFVPEKNLYKNKKAYVKDTKTNLSNIMKTITKHFKVKEYTNRNYENVKVRVKIIDNQTQKSRMETVRFHILNNNSLNAMLVIIINLCFLDLEKHYKYRLVINNRETVKHDVKSTTFFYKEPLSTTFEIMKKEISKISDKLNDEAIVFANKKNKKTHTITIQKCGKTSDYKKMKTKSFSIELTNYSSSEILEKLQKIKKIDTVSRGESMKITNDEVFT